MHPRLHLVLRLKGKRTEVGEHHVQIRLLDDRDTEILGGNGNVTFAEPPAGVTEIEAGAILVFDVPFPHAGAYRFQITVDGEMKAAVPVTVSQLPAPAPRGPPRGQGGPPVRGARALPPPEPPPPQSPRGSSGGAGGARPRGVPRHGRERGRTVLRVRDRRIAAGDAGGELARGRLGPGCGARRRGAGRRQDRSDRAALAAGRPRPAEWLCRRLLGARCAQVAERPLRLRARAVPGLGVAACRDGRERGVPGPRDGS